MERKVEGKKSREKIIFSSCLDQGKNVRIWMRNLNVDELLKLF